MRGTRWTLATVTLAALLGCGSAPEAAVAERVSGTFDVELAPVESPEGAEAFFGRMTLDKQFHGGLRGSSEGLMLAVRTEYEESAGYVAMEKFTGALDGREGSFVLQHSGIMDRGGEGHHLVEIVPDSGTDGLEGISGSMTIEILEGEHRYELEYDLRE